jgi:integrase
VSAAAATVGASTDAGAFPAALLGQPLWDYQIDLVRLEARHRVVCSGRQVEKSYALAWRLLRRLAKTAGIAGAERISPHSMRHTHATIALDAGVPLRDVQDSMGHADPRTTRLYDRTRGNLDRNATYAVTALLAED